MTQNNSLSRDAKEKINAIILNLLLKNRGYAKQEFSSSELQQLSRQMANGIQINQEEIIGLYDGSIANSFSGNFSGVLFLKDRIYVNLRRSSNSECMYYADMASLSGDPSSFIATLILTSTDGNKILLKGLSYTTPTVYAVFENIIKAVDEFKRTPSIQQEHTKVVHADNLKNIEEEDKIENNSVAILTPLQEDMLSFLLEHSFSDYDKKQKPHLDDWKNNRSIGNILACEKYSLFTWREYAFYTEHALYYHCKKQGVHILLHYSGINYYDNNTSSIDYGREHKKINISQWATHIKSFIQQISNIKTLTDAHDTSVFEFCFNRCSDFKNELIFFKTKEVRNVFNAQCYLQNAPELLRENYDHIEITSINSGKIKLQYRAYFPKVETIQFREDDSEYDIREKEREQERLYEEAEERMESAQWISEQLPSIKDDIILLFKEAIYNLYGVMFQKENITFLEDPNFTFEELSLAERFQNKVAPVKSIVDSMMESTARQMADLERKYNKDT